MRERSSRIIGFYLQASSIVCYKNDTQVIKTTRVLTDQTVERPMTAGASRSKA